MARLHLIALGLVALLAGCASKAPAPAAGTDPAAVAVPDMPPQLAAERRWLEQLFDGTPVTVGATVEGAVRLEVPLKYSFDNGRPAIKPPLNAVLDKVAVSLARQKRAKLQLAAPAERGNSLRDAMLARGIAPYRIERLPPRADAVELRLLAAPPAIDKLEDPPSVTRR